MKDILTLVGKDLKNSFHKKFFLLLIFLLLFQLWFIAGSGSVEQVRKSGELSYMAAVFSFNFFGSIVALALNYNGVSAERESKIMDMILMSGISKRKVYFGKICTGVFVSAVFAVLYSTVIAVFYLALSGDFLISLQALRYIVPITVFLMIFNGLGLVLSVAMRSSKASLIICIIVGALMMPRLFVSIIDGINSIIGLSEAVIERIYLLSPALILNSLNGYSDTNTVLWGLLLFAIYVIGSMVTGICIFQKQDELNYGE